MPNIPALSPQDEEQALAELRQKFPKVSDELLKGFLQGRTPPTPERPQRTESEPPNPQALQHCLDLVNTSYNDAVKAAESVKPDWLKACMVASALVAAFFGRLECYDENG